MPLGVDDGVARGVSIAIVDTVEVAEGLDPRDKLDVGESGTVAT